MKGQPKIPLTLSIELRGPRDVIEALAKELVQVVVDGKISSQISFNQLLPKVQASFLKPKVK